MEKDSLKEEAEGMMGQMKDNPLFSQLMGMQSMFGQMGQQGQQQGQQGMQAQQGMPETRNISVSNNKEGDRNAAARKKAKSKLDKRKKVKVNKSD